MGKPICDADTVPGMPQVCIIEQAAIIRAFQFLCRCAHCPRNWNAGFQHGANLTSVSAPCWKPAFRTASWAGTRRGGAGFLEKIGPLNSAAANRHEYPLLLRIPGS